MPLQCVGTSLIFATNGSTLIQCRCSGDWSRKAANDREVRMDNQVGDDPFMLSEVQTDYPYTATLSRAWDGPTGMQTIKFLE